MNKQILIELAKDIYRVSLSFPKREPLRYLVREAADELVACYIKNPKNEMEMIAQIDIIDSFLDIACSQNWMLKDDIDQVREKYRQLVINGLPAGMASVGSDMAMTDSGIDSQTSENLGGEEFKSGLPDAAATEKGPETNSGNDHRASEIDGMETVSKTIITISGCSSAPMVSIRDDGRIAIVPDVSNREVDCNVANIETKPDSGIEGKNDKITLEPESERSGKLPEIIIAQKDAEDECKEYEKEDAENGIEAGDLTASQIMRQNRIMEYLKEKGAAQVWEIQEIFPEISKRTIRRDFCSMLKQGLIERTGERNTTAYKIKINIS